MRPDIYDVIKHAEPLTHAVTYSFPSNLRRRYERFTKFPGNYLVMGDALCSFNPLYGQGMSVATLEALALRECLEHASSVRDVWRPFFKAAGKIIDGPWMIAAGSDFAFEGVTGPKPQGHAARQLVPRPRPQGRVHRPSRLPGVLRRGEPAGARAVPVQAVHPGARLARVRGDARAAGDRVGPIDHDATRADDRDALSEFWRDAECAELAEC